jgi:hypothetical protein
LEDSADYQQAVALVDMIDSNPGLDSVPVDIGAAFSSRLDMKLIKYSQATQMLASIPGLKVEPVQEAQPQPQPKPQVQVPKHELKKEMNVAAAKLGGMAGSAGKEFQQGVVKKAETIDESKLVMPKLSVPDQLSDLEKMSEGMSEGVFDKEQLKIIAQELNGLLHIAASESTSGMSDDLRELILIRNQRVKELITKLNMS